MSQARSTEACGQCHGFVAPRSGKQYYVEGQTYLVGEELVQHHISKTQEDKAAFLGFWPDGSTRIGGRETPSMMLSACYQQGDLTCLSCHTMHGWDPADQVKPRMKSDAACLQCHQEYADRIEEHTFHEASSEGSRCYHCHMPHTSYALLGAARSHRIDSPVASGATPQEKPNACNLCHLDQTLSWTARWLKERYDIEPPELTDEHDSVAAGVLWAVRGNAAQRVIAAWHLGRPWAHEAAGQDWIRPYLADLLVDPYAAIRMVADRSLRDWTEPAIAFDYIGPPEERERARQQHLERWRRDELPPELAARTLMDDAGRDAERLATILAERDETKIWLAE